MISHRKHNQKGQTLFEFALTLPILLLLVFGIIEFGRVFQAWVTLNNAARTAARYASTGQYNETKYVINEDRTEDPDSIVDCVLNSDLRGTLGDRAVNPDETVEVYDGREGLFATWYDGENCEPNRVDHQDMRKDIARILSITDEARRGAAGLALGPDPLEGVTTEAQVRDFLYGFWERPLPGSGNYIDQAGADQPSWFEVVICSSRGARNEASAQYSTDQSTRFLTILDPDDITDDPAGQANRAPECILNEQPPAVGGATQNAGTPWLDAGGPGDTVSLVITFNHPLITPLGLAPYLPLQARRAAVNETFRAAEATGALRGGGAITADINIAPVAVATVQNGSLGGDGYTITVGPGDTNGIVFLDGTGSYDPDGDISELHYRWHRNLPDGTTEIFVDPGTGQPYDDATPPGWRLPLGRHEIFLTVTDAEGAEDTDTVIVIIAGPDPTNTPTSTPQPVPSNTPVQPFSCDRLTAGDVEFFNNRVFIQFTNNNTQETVMTRAQFYWKRLALYPNMNVSGMSLNGILHWRGQDFTPPTDTNADPPNPANLFLESDRRVSGLSTATWEAVFANGPSPLQDPFAGIYHMTQNDLSGTTFTFQNPEGGFCVIPLTLPTPTPAPKGKATNTPPPVCISGDLQIRFVEFRTFGVVRMSITNLRTYPAELTDFSINWTARNGQRLEWVAVGGSSATDRVNGVVVWQAASGQDTNPPTVGGSTAASANAVNNRSTGATGREGTWLTNYTLPANSTTNVWLKFGVTNSPPDTAFGMLRSDLNGSWFQIGCAAGGAGAVNVQQEPSPFPSNTPGPTNTPRPTFTPSKTFTPGPTNTPPPPATITNTPRPSNTPPPTATNTRVPPGGGGDTGGVDG